MAECIRFLPSLPYRQILCDPPSDLEGQRVAIGFVAPRVSKPNQRLHVHILDHPVGATILDGAAYDPEGRLARA
jgi:glycine cleavage system aminomethyltransferase T